MNVVFREISEAVRQYLKAGIEDAAQFLNRVLAYYNAMLEWIMKLLSWQHPREQEILPFSRLH